MSSATLERPTTAPAANEPVATAEASRPRAEAATPAAPAVPSYRTLFTVPFQTVMSDADVRGLNGVLDMATHLHPKLHASPASPGVARLDFFSGLFLIRGDGPDEWRLEGRTWGSPAAETAHGWHLVAADAARLLDPRVPVPVRLESPEASTAPLARRGRWSRRRRRARRARS